MRIRRRTGKKRNLPEQRSETVCDEESKERSVGDRLRRIRIQGRERERFSEDPAGKAGSQVVHYGADLQQGAPERILQGLLACRLRRIHHCDVQADLEQREGEIYEVDQV